MITDFWISQENQNLFHICILLGKKQEEVENYDANVSEDSTRNAIVIERTPTEVSNRSSDDETQPKPKDTKNNEKKGMYLFL